jgi:wyosine [tRNA(Phe)-imidazoG37] synthetase (radical SAM superfamily)
MSLGVDLVPFKICTLNCVYCECGLTTKLTLQRKEYVLLKDITDELTHFFEKSPEPDYITLTGSGEPTLNTRIGDVIDFCKTKFPSKVAVLTNGTLLYDPQVRKELLNADVVLPSFDAAKIDSFRKINKPHEDLIIDNYLQD